MNYASSPCAAMPIAATKGIDVTPAALQVMPPSWRTFTIKYVAPYFVVPKNS